MAFGKGKVSTGESNYSRYVGIAKLKCLGVNLDDATLSKIYNREIQSKREAVSEAEINGVKYPRATLRFTVSREDEGDGISFIGNVDYPVIRCLRWDSDHQKIQVIDKYGRTAWATEEEASAHKIPMYANGPANIDSDYRPAYMGEENLVKFLQALLNIPNVTKFVDKKPAGLIDNPEDAECRLEKIENYFKGDFSEVAEILSYQPNNKVILCAGVKTDDQNRQWQDFYTRLPLRAGTRSFEKLKADIESSQNAGAFPNTVFDVCDLKEYKDTPTEVAPTDATNNPAPWFKKPE